jgi:hypothetical protein
VLDRVRPALSTALSTANACAPLLDDEDHRIARQRSVDLACFAYLSLPARPGATPHYITAYPVAWTMHYLKNHYERLDPVIARVLSNPELL